ncbi:hypothetical protein [Chryseolinea sp. H1M3-3]|uniref:hypothetical protein n=1 Tax=Chryseolinea sp. H1M3-3 TaxID=3034144 RepID=UPI0023EE27F3|nr:hypothetical protein [Chryseolinea sp. H1M3-3]
MKINGLLFFGLVGCCMSMMSCGRGKELLSEKNYDSLFLGIHLGMTRSEFYDHCAELNRLKVFTHGPTNTSVEYMLTSELEKPVVMRFYPSFYKDRIVDMPVTFSYEAWAPWNKQFSSDSLLTKMLPVFKKWYGEDFKVIQHPSQGKVYVKMDGKRRINLFLRDDQFVQAVFTDLALEKERKREEAEKSN